MWVTLVTGLISAIRKGLMKISIRQIFGNWDLGYTLDKHVLSSVYICDDNYGHPQFETTRSEVGEALFQLKYRDDWAQIEPLAEELAASIYPKFENVGVLIPMSASNVRPRQPVTELTKSLGKIVEKPVFDNLLIKKPNGPQLKNITNKDEKLAVMKDCFTVSDVIEDAGPWNALLVDDLFDTGASLETACAVLRGYPKIAKIYVAALTW